MTNLVSKISSCMKKEKGATMVEYAIMVALIAVVSIVVIKGLGKQVSGTFNSVSQELSSATTSSSSSSGSTTP
jgi:pilus assembly protein Flp/PilA